MCWSGEDACSWGAYKKKQLVYEKEQVDFEHKRAEEWVGDLKESFNWEDTAIGTCYFIQEGTRAPPGRSDGGVVSVSDMHAQQLLLSQHLLEMEPVQWQRRVEVVPPVLVMVAQQRLQVIQILQDIQSTIETGSETGHSTLLVVTELLKAQTEAMTAQAQAAEVQQLPDLHSYTGEDDQMMKCWIDVSKNVRS